MSKAKAKGTSYEVSLLPLFRRFYPNADRLPPKGSLDCGDIGAPEMPYVVEAKNYLDYSGKLPQWLREAEIEAGHAGRDYGIVVFKRRGTTDPAKQYALMELGTLLELLNGERQGVPAQATQAGDDERLGSTDSCVLPSHDGQAGCVIRQLYADGSARGDGKVAVSTGVSPA